MTNNLRLLAVSNFENNILKNILNSVLLYHMPLLIDLEKIACCCRLLCV